jgi:hypothetical protein
MLIFFTSHRKMIAWLFVLQKAKWTRWGETAKSHKYGELHQGRQGWQSFWLSFPQGDQYRWFMDCLQQVVEKNKDVFLALGIHTGNLSLHSAWKGRVVLLWWEALSAHQWSPFACGQCGVWGRLRSATSSLKN